MCGIVGYVGEKQARDVVIEGLRRLEYRGYDSAGIAVIADGSISSDKRAGKLANLEKAIVESPLPESTTGIGHTRWATHGAPNDTNAHPHLGPDDRVALVHNGIIENFARLRAELQAAGVEQRSETDTEIAAQLLEREVAAGADLTTAMQRVCRRLEGAFTLVAVDAQDPSRVVAARRNSPLVVGLGEGENFLGSDVAAFIEHTREALELAQDQVVTITREGVEVSDFDGNPAEGTRYHVDWDLSAAEKDGYDWFMRKEIFEQPRAVGDALLGRHTEDGRLQLDEVRISEEELRDIDRIIIVGCGTANYAGMVAKYAIEHWTRIPCEVELAHEFRYRDPILTRNTLVVAISQSGETADTLMAIRHAREQKSKVLAICNTNGSTIPRESDAVIYTHAGPEIGVASTKGFMTQMVACYLLALYLAQVRGTKFGDEISAVVTELENGAGPPRPAARRRGERLRARPRARVGALGAVPRSPRRLPDRARGRAQAQGAGLHPRRGLRGRRAQARSDRADRARAAGVLRGAAPGPGPAARQDGERDPGGAGPRRTHDRARGGGRRRGRPVRRHVAVAARRTHAAAADGRRDPAPALRVRARHRQGPRRGPAAQPGQVGHRRVTAPR